MTTATETKGAKTEAKERRSITIDLTESSAVYDLIVNEAELDDRSPAKWVSRFLAHHFTKETLTTPTK